MKKSIFILLFTLLYVSQTVSHEYEYVPFVREGVKWVYVCKNPYWVEEFWEQVYYSFEMKSDVLIGDKYYKPVQLTRYSDRIGSSKVVEDFTPVYLREEDKIVYAIIADGIFYPQCPVGYGGYIGYPYDDSPITCDSQEFKLYDFNDPMSLYEDLHPGPSYSVTSMIAFGNKNSKCHHYTWDYWE